MNIPGLVVQPLEMHRDERGHVTETFRPDWGLDFAPAQMARVLIPHGVAHGLYALEDSLCLVGGTELYDRTDDLEFSYADPDLGFDWPEEPRFVSERDRNAPSLPELLARLR